LKDRSEQFVREIVIVGGGTAGWMTAAALSHKLAGTDTAIRLIESAEIGTVGVGEATLPQIREYNRLLGIDEAELMARTSATIKLGIEFRDWGRAGDHYIHPFGVHGEPIGAADFDQLIMTLRDTLGLSVYMVTHDLDSLYAICDRIAVLIDKRTRVGTLAELERDDHPWIKEYFRGPRGRAAAMAAQMFVVDVGPGRWNPALDESGSAREARKKYSKAALTRAENRPRFGTN